MERQIFSKRDVLEWLENAMELNVATQEEEEILQDYHWSRKLVNDDRLKRVKRKMKKEYDY